MGLVYPVLAPLLGGMASLGENARLMFCILLLHPGRFHTKNILTGGWPNDLEGARLIDLFTCLPMGKGYLPGEETSPPRKEHVCKPL